MPDFDPAAWVTELALSIPRDDLLLKGLTEEQYIAVIHRILVRALAVLHEQGRAQPVSYPMDAWKTGGLEREMKIGTVAQVGDLVAVLRKEPR